MPSSLISRTSSSDSGDPMSWPDVLQELIDEFSDIDDAMERLEILFELAAEVDELPVAEWTEANRIHGCQSEAHIECSLEDGGFRMRGGADAQIVQGLMTITQRAVNGRPAAEVAGLEPTFIEAMGLKASLTPSRSNGFLNMFKRVREEAEALA